MSDWTVSQLPDGYWKVSRPDGTSESNWRFFHDEMEALEFIRQAGKAHSFTVGTDEMRDSLVREK